MINSRKDFPFLLHAFNLRGFGAEIGVERGIFSEYLLSTWQCKLLYSIDSWKHDDCWFDAANVTQEQHNANLDETKNRLSRFKDRSKILILSSEEASKLIPDNSLDFCFVDARHDYRSIDKDLFIWYPKIKIGGIFAGHDYKNSFVRRNLVEVKRAVDNFFLQREKIFVTLEDNIPSWFIIKGRTEDL